VARDRGDLAVGDLDGVRRRFETTLAWNREHGLSDHDSFALLRLATVAHRRGRLDEAAGLGPIPFT
jgi:hypothetical protein